MDALTRRRPLREALDGLPMFDVAPDIQTPAPSAPGSRSSEDAADCVSNPMRALNHRKILHCLRDANGPISMREIARRTSLEINIVTARLSELRPLWVERHELACRSTVKPSLRVDGFTLTAAGRRASEGG